MRFSWSTIVFQTERSLYMFPWWNIRKQALKRLTKRITNTPWQERSVSFSPDGLHLIYAAEKDNNWNIYKISNHPKRKSHIFYVSTVLTEEPVVATPAEEYQPEFSPDGKRGSILETGLHWRFINLASRVIRTIMSADKNYHMLMAINIISGLPTVNGFLCNSDIQSV